KTRGKTAPCESDLRVAKCETPRHVVHERGAVTFGAGCRPAPQSGSSQFLIWHVSAPKATPLEWSRVHVTDNRARHSVQGGAEDPLRGRPEGRPDTPRNRPGNPRRTDGAAFGQRTTSGGRHRPAVRRAGAEEHPADAGATRPSRRA